MELLLSVFCVLMTAYLTQTVHAQDDEGPCFQFNGDGFLEFTPNNFFNTGRTHFSFKMRTNEPHGVLMFTEGNDDDLEILYYRDGLVAYQLFNPDSDGIGGDYGGFFQTNTRVDTGEWFEIHVYRTYNIRDLGRRRTQLITGVKVVSPDGTEDEAVDNFPRDDIDLQSIIYFGGHFNSLSSVVGRYNGEMKDMRETKHNKVFRHPSLNYGSKVEVCDPFIGV